MFFFFFKQKTAYEMRISDWSSDVCSSDLLRFDIGWDWVPLSQRHGRERFYQRFRPFRGGKKHQPQDSYALRCMPQVHGAVRDALAQAQREIGREAWRERVCQAG